MFDFLPCDWEEPLLFRFLPLPPRSVASPPKELRPKEVRSSPMVPIVVNICRRFSLNTRMGLVGDSCSLRFVFNRPGSTFTFLTLYEEFWEQFYFKFVQKIRSISFKFPCIFSVVIFQLKNECGFLRIRIHSPALRVKKFKKTDVTM